MTTENLERGNEIKSRIRDLDKMQRWLEVDAEKRAVFLSANGCILSDFVKISNDMCTAILGMCIGEKSRLEKEFENL